MGLYKYPKVSKCCGVNFGIEGTRTVCRKCGQDCEVVRREVDHEVFAETDWKEHKGEKEAFGDYRTKVQLLKYGDGTHDVRFAYQMRRIKKNGQFYWHNAGQTTWSFPQATTEEAIEDSIRKDILFKSQKSRDSLRRLLQNDDQAEENL